MQFIFSTPVLIRYLINYLIRHLLYFETSGHQSSKLYLNVVHFFNTSINYTSMPSKDCYFPALVSNMHYSVAIMLYIIMLSVIMLNKSVNCLGAELRVQLKNFFVGTKKNRLRRQTHDNLVFFIKIIFGAHFSGQLEGGGEKVKE